MAKELLQEMVEAISFDDLPPAWNSFDLESFSRDKRLWREQQDALRHALRALQRYYDEWSDYRPGEAGASAEARKVEFLNWYRRNGLDPADLEIVLKNHTIKNRELIALLGDYYQPAREEALQVSTRVYFSYRDFINRMGFWMATGSGKTLVLIKLIELLHHLIQLEEIPAHDILVLTYRDDLIDQLKAHVQEFNAGHADLSIRLYSLKDYAQVKRGPRPLPGELPVFIYRSDNLSDEAGQKILDFRSYENEGRWYVLLDEAHKGDSEESKRQHIYSILARNGFLFNFSATFTDVHDIATTVYNFNLAEFIRAGYGKHIAVLEQEIRAFRDQDEDYTDEEKQKIVLKSLLMLAYAQDFQSLTDFASLQYHKPLLVMLGHTVNTDKADVKLFFRELVKIGKGEVGPETWQAAKDELWDELRQRPAFMFEEDAVCVQEQRFRALSLDDLRELVFNERSPGEIEVLKRPSNHKEVAFKLKTGEQPFALIKIGDISGWLKGNLAGYEVSETFEDESFFERLDEHESDINILMGSRTFYEGWDSNRPNVMNFVNIGMGTEARKFILQSVGRGVRIEPLPNARRRLLPLSNAGQVDPATFAQVSERGDPRALPIETLFIFGTNRSALHFVINHLDQVRRKEEAHTLSLSLNEQAAQHRLLIPIFRTADRLLVEEREPPKFETTAEERDLLAAYVEALDDRVLLARYGGVEPKKIAWLRHGLQHADTYFRTTGKAVKHLDLLTRRAFEYLGVVPQEFERLEELEDEIQHFRRIKVTLRDIYGLQQKIAKVKEYRGLREKLEAQYGQLSFDEFERQRRQLNPTAFFEHDGQRIRIEYIAQHYYIPTILSETERADFIRHVIKVPSEVNFVKDLNDYVAQSTNLFAQFDWWLFSKLDEHLDKVYLPYYDPKANRIRKFKPDFIFWLQKGADYYIVFIDPKGAGHTDYEHKVDGYRHLFEDENTVRSIEHDGLAVRVFTFLHTEAVGVLSDGYKRYWFDDIKTVLSQLLQTSLASP